MSKFIFIPKNEIEVKNSISYVDAYLFGIDGLSVNFERYMTLEELIPIISFLKENGKEVFLSLNKNMHHRDLTLLEETLTACCGLAIDGIFYYDASVVMMKQEGIFDLPLIWSQEHLATNYDTCLFWKKEGVSKVLVSSEITLDEIMTMEKKCDMDLIVPIFGYLPMFASKRNLVHNYLERFSISSDERFHWIKKEGYQYPIINDHTGTQVYSSHILNGMNEMLTLKEAGVSYFLFNSFHIKTDTMMEVLKQYQTVTRENVLEKEELLDTLLEGNTDKGFFYKETVFRVKRNEK